METLIAFSKSPMGEIIIRVLCILFIGAFGFKVFVMKIADIFEQYARGEKRKRIIDLISDVISMLGTVALSILISFVYREKQTDLYLIVEGMLYGLGAVGLYQFIDKKLVAYIRAYKGKNGKK